MDRKETRIYKRLINSYVANNQIKLTEEEKALLASSDPNPRELSLLFTRLTEEYN